MTATEFTDCESGDVAVPKYLLLRGYIWVECKRAVIIEKEQNL